MMTMVVVVVVMMKVIVKETPKHMCNPGLRGRRNKPELKTLPHNLESHHTHHSLKQKLTKNT